MPNFYATTATGLSDLLEKELHELGMTKTEKISSGVFFDTNWEGCYKVNLNSRLASRVLKPILDFPAYSPDDIYHNVLKHDFTKYILPNQTFKVEASMTDCKIQDQRLLAMTVKDAIADQYTDKFGERPSIDNNDPVMRVMIKGFKNQYHMAIDTSGDSLFLRGYRARTGDAPMKENLAAGLLHLAEWDRQSPVVDPLCGSGTILIEAAMMALNIAPGTFRKRFGFMDLQGFQSEVWDKVLEEALDKELTELPFKFYGSDIDFDMVKMAKDNARRAGVDHVIDFKKETVATIEPGEGVTKGIIITNPPYGARLGDEDNLRDVYRDMSYTFKHRFKGWNAWVLSGNKDLIMDLKLKSTRRHFVYNGPIECRFLKYEMF